MSGPTGIGGGSGGGAVTPTPSGPIGGHLNRLVGSVAPPRAGGKSTRPKPKTVAKTVAKTSGANAPKSTAKPRKPRTTRSK